MKIIIDAMGGDHAPAVTVEGAVLAINKLGYDIVLCGHEDSIKSELLKHSYPKDKLKVVHCDEIIENCDDPVRAIRRKKNSSMVVGMQMLQNGEGDAIVSAGNTGALIAASSTMLGKLTGVRRPALAPIMPTDSGFAVLVDAGANSECKPDYLYQFAIMGSFYIEKVFNITRPKVGLVNIGSEEAKGNELTKGAFALLKQSSLNFIGNIEARRIPYGDVQVVVTDGFTGNVLLKMFEGMGLTMYANIKELFSKNLLSKLAALLVMDGLKAFKKKMDYSEYGGAPVLGVNGPVFKAHGSSNAYAFYNAIRQAGKFVETGVLNAISENINNDGNEED